MFHVQLSVFSCVTAHTKNVHFSSFHLAYLLNHVDKDGEW